MHIEFTKHALEQMNERSISEDEVISTIQYSEKTLKIEGIYHAQKNIGRCILEVVYVKQNYIRVVTLYPL